MATPSIGWETLKDVRDIHSVSLMYTSLRFCASVRKMGRWEDVTE